MLYTFFEMMWIPGDTKKDCGPTVKVAGYGGQLNNEILAGVWLTVGPEFILWLFFQFHNV